MTKRLRPTGKRQQVLPKLKRALLVKKKAAVESGTRKEGHKRTPFRKGKSAGRKEA